MTCIIPYKRLFVEKNNKINYTRKTIIGIARVVSKCYMNDFILNVSTSGERNQLCAQ